MFLLYQPLAPTYKASLVHMHRDDRGHRATTSGATGDHGGEDERIRRIQVVDFNSLAAGLPYRVAGLGVSAPDVQMAVVGGYIEDVQVGWADLHHAGMWRPRVRDFEQSSVACQVWRCRHKQASVPLDQ